MSRNQSRQSNSFGRAARKFTLSAFVVFTFAAYAFHQRFTSPDGAANSVAPTTVAAQVVGQVPQPLPTYTPIPLNGVAGATQSQSSSASGATFQSAPAATATSQSGSYKDGTYIGPSVDAYYGNVQVQVSIQGGKISDVTFLDFPHDRRTSQEINAQATPWLQQEAIQAQSANVDLISGATLTSEAFVQSLQTALQSAHN